MATCIDHASATNCAMHATALSLIVLMALVALVVLSGCSPEADTAAPQPRPVRTVTIEQRAAGASVTLTGRIEAEDEVALAFRISGRMLENDRKLGDRIEAGQVVARLELQNERNALRAAQANLVASQGQLTRRAIISSDRTLCSSKAGPPAPITTRPSRPCRQRSSGRCGRSADENRVRPRELYRTEGGRAWCGHCGRPQCG